MRNYEFTIIFDTTEEKTQAGLKLVTSLFEAASVEITKQDDMGVRLFAYEMKKQDKGHYFYYEISADPASIVTFEKKFLLSNTIIKYLFVSKEK
ncbi:MAG: 30S ribosomal protein S6 [Spirochaetaceae bacterium]|jgi:small subunit ribosomal protein S6|nr:30S ribosomal protein S6 [Spirochaetaceae bacterium]